ncbi:MULTISPECIES: hypothetical protein [Aeromonas]|nr:hypothetical protein [Aeromonas veronii]MBL0591832.1 hypothetical protein [Aeromonas veronii]QHC08205.1 hypothetical protein GRF56_12655 [Aeromonas veronii]
MKKIAAVSDVLTLRWRHYASRTKQEEGTMLAARKTKILRGSEYKVQEDVISLRRGWITTMKINQNGQDVRGSMKYQKRGAIEVTTVKRGSGVITEIKRLMKIYQLT